MEDRNYNEIAHRNDMIDVIKKMYGLTLEDSRKVTTMYETALESLLSQGKNVVLNDHARYTLAHLKPRMMHLGTEEPYPIPASLTIRFKASKSTLERVKGALGYETKAERAAKADDDEVDE